MDRITILERPVEYEQALVNFRYFLDHKTKLFGFIIAINSILYPIILNTLQTQATKVIASVMVVILLIFAAVFDRRTTHQIRIFLREAKRIERALDFEMIQNTYPGRNAGGAFAFAYTAMYIVAIVFWCVHIMIISKTFEAQELINMFTALFQTSPF